MKNSHRIPQMTEGGADTTGVGWSRAWMRCHSAVFGMMVRAGWRMGKPSSFNAAGATAVEEAFNALPEHVRELEDVARRLEECFLALGSSLEKLPDASEKLVNSSEHLLALATGDGTGNETFAEIMRLLEGPLGFIDQSQQTFAALGTRLHAAIKQIDSLTSAEAVLHRAVAPLRFIQTIFKIESAPLSPSIQLMFLALTEDIERLHQQVSQTFGEKFAALRGVRATLSEAHERVEGYSRIQGAVLVEKRRQIAAALTTLNEGLQQKVARNTQLTDIARLIHEEVGRMVVCLQSQDIINQKVAHICAAVRAVDENIPAAFTAARGKGDPEELAFVAASCRLQSAQVAGVSKDLDDAHQSIGDAVKRIQTHLCQLDDQAPGREGCDTVTVNADRLVESLIETIEEVRGMVNKTLASADEAFIAIQSVGGLASNLTVVMRELSSQIQIIGLNAQVQAAHNCGGTGLEVLAAHTALISTETGTASEYVANGVDSFTAELNNLVGQFGRLRDEATVWQKTMEDEFRRQERTLHGIRNATLDELRAVTECLREVTDLVQGMALANQLKSIAGECFESLAGEFDAAAGKAMAKLESGGTAPDLTKFSGRLSAGYSVASEHEIHRRVFGIAALAPVGDDFLPGAADETHPRSQMTGAGLSATDADHARKGGDGAAVVSVVAVAAESHPNETLGDNVELF